jgi:ubiquitin carboxyl-terminal hydrolase 4/11/15
LHFKVHSGGLDGVLLNVFPVCSADDDIPTNGDRAESRTAIIPKDSDEPIISFLGEESAQRFLYIWLEWTEVADDEKTFVSRFNEERFLTFKTDATYSEAAENQQALLANQVVSLDDCFISFQRAERLDEENTWYCSECREHVQPLKTMQLFKLPNILVVHLKRFEYKHMFRRDKLDTFVRFPLDGLDLGKHCATDAHSSFIDRGSIPAEYDLFAVVNHYGRLGFGHYTSYARRFDESGGMGNWVHCDDSSVDEIDNPESIVTSAAYVLFYRRRVFS